MGAILDGGGIRAWYGSSQVLHGIDLAIGRGRTLGLLGRSAKAVPPSSARTFRAPGRTRWRAWAWPTCPRGAACSAT